MMCDCHRLGKGNKRYSSYNSNIKYVGSTIKCIGFELIHYVINFNIVSSSMIFSNALKTGLDEPQNRSG